jgi:hypothetical protein
MGRPVHRGPAAIAAHGRSTELGLRPLWCPRAPAKGGGGEGRAGKLNGEGTAGHEAVEGSLGGVGFGNGGDGGGAQEQGK